MVCLERSRVFSDTAVHVTLCLLTIDRNLRGWTLKVGIEFHALKFFLIITRTLIKRVTCVTAKRYYLETKSRLCIEPCGMTGWLLNHKQEVHIYSDIK